MKKETFRITGMSCSACSAAVEKAVVKLNGTENAQVNLLAESMTVLYNENVLSESDIINAVANAGYKAEVKSSAVEKKQKNLEKSSKKIKLRLIISLICLVLLMIISMGHMVKINIIPHNMSITKGITELILLIPILILNCKYFTSGIKALLMLHPNMDSLIATGAGASVIYSLWQMATGGSEHYYFESAGMILTFITIGKYLESKSKAKTTSAVTKLMDLSPKSSVVLRNDKEIVVDSKDILKGDIVVIKSGMVFPADGTIIEGSGHADESAITGESIPVKKVVSSKVIGGTTLTNGYVKFKAEKTGEETTLSEIIRLVEEATLTKPKIAKFADKISSFFVPTVIALAILTFIIWFIVTNDFELSLNFGISVLVISCPCALGLATPTAIMVGTGKAAELGILVKNAEIFEAGSKINTVMLDKTGTLTEGKPVVTDIFTTDTEKNRLMSICSAIEKLSDHPLALAIASYTTETTDISIDNFKAVTGKGVSACVGNSLYKIGNKKFVSDKTLDNIFLDESKKYAKQGKTAVYVSKNNQVTGIIAVADTIKSNSIDAVKMLKASSVKTVMITGDNRTTAEAIGKQVNIDEIHAELMPSDKNSIIKKYQHDNKVAMVGDGINDSPALATADLGIALGAGTDIAMESADVVLLKNDLRDVYTTLDICKRVMKNIKENLFWALIYNSICIPLAAGLLYAPLSIKLSPMIGTVAMSLSSLCVISNALRLKRIKRIYKNEERIENEMKTIHIEGMACPHCQARVHSLLEPFDSNVVVDHIKGTAVISDNVDNDAVSAAITSGGYKVTGIE